MWNHFQETYNHMSFYKMRGNSLTVAKWWLASQWRWSQSYCEGHSNCLNKLVPFFFAVCLLWEILLKGEVDRWPCLTSPGNECCFIDLLMTNGSGLAASNTGNKWNVLYWNSTLHNFWTSKSVISYKMPLGCFFKKCCLQIEFTNNLLLSQSFRKSLKWETDDKAEKEWSWGTENITVSQVPRDIKEKDRKNILLYNPQICQRKTLKITLLE